MAEFEEDAMLQPAEDRSGWTQPTKDFLRQPTGKQAVYTLADYLSGSVSSRYKDVLPFFMELIDDNGNPARLFDDDQEVYAVKFDVNPTTINMNMAKMVNRTQTMTGWVEDHWGEELDTITFQGSTAAFIVGGNSLYGVRRGAVTAEQAAEFNRRKPPDDAFGVVDTESNVTPPDAIGLTTAYRRQSVSYRRLKRILQAMATNGCRFGKTLVTTASESTTPVQSNSLGLVSGRSYIRISSDYLNAVGYLESFDVTEAAEMPFRIQYTITFKAEKTELTYVRQSQI